MTGGEILIYGFDKCEIEDDPEEENIEDELEMDNIEEEGVDRRGNPYWYDRHHPIHSKRKKDYDTSPYMNIELTKCSIHDYKHGLELTEEKRNRLKDGDRWTTDDYDLTYWGNRGGGRAKLVAYRRRKAVEDPRTDSLSILRVVQNDRLVSFLIKNSYGSCRLIPYTQLTVTDNGSGMFGFPERFTHWLSIEKFVHITKEVEDERKRLPMIDLAELRNWGEFGCHWLSGSKYSVTVKVAQASRTHIAKTNEEEIVDI